MMLNIILILTINTYKPLQTHCTKLIPHLGSTLQKLAILKIEVHFFLEGGSQFCHSVEKLVR